MIITFNELRIKDRLPSGSSQRIADELGISVDSVRNYFGGRHPEAKEGVGIHIEQGPDGGVVTLDDTTILDAAMRILNEKKGAGVFCCIPYRRADRGQAGCGMTAMSEREFRAAIVTVGMSVLPAVCQILRSGKAGWCEKNIWYNLCSLPIVRKAVTEPGKRN